MKKALNIDANLVAGSNGIFDVVVDGNNKVFSKYDTGRFPEPGEIVRLLVQDAR